MITFQKESLRELWEDIQPLWFLHWQEFGLNKETIPLSPDQQKYFLAENAGIFHLMTCRDGDELVGYSMSFIDNGLHYNTIIEALPDIHFIHPRYKERAFLVCRLIEETEIMQKELGVTRAFLTEKVHRNAQPIMERKGYVLVERIYAKLLE